MEEGADAGDAADAEVMAAHLSPKANLKPRTLKAHLPKVHNRRGDLPSLVLARIKAGNRTAASRIAVPAVVAASSSDAKVEIADPPTHALQTPVSIRLRWTTATAR